MDKETAERIIRAHKEWRQRLLDLAYTGNISTWSSPNEVADPTICEMGKILVTLGEKGHPELQEIKRVHSEFHLAAAEIYSLCKQNKVEEVERQLSPITGNFMNLTLSLVQLISKLSK